MTDESPPRPLTDQALIRLRKLAEDNGLAASQIELKDSDEKIYTLEATLSLTPKCEIQQTRYPGAVRGKGRKIFSNFAALHAEAQRRREQFNESRDWIDASIKELKEQPGQGWGLQGALVTLPEKSSILAATETCSACQGRKLLTCEQCQGQGSVVCTQCQGRGQETCPTCNGHGDNPLMPGTPCITCHGTRQTVCRFCRASGKLPCPTCGGRGGTPCIGCQGAGRITEEAGIACSAETQFKLSGEGLPIGLRRGLERLGVANLVKGYADIEIIEPKPDPDNPGEAAHEQAPQTGDGEENKTRKPEPVLHYGAKLPYADIKIRFGEGRVVLISAFGKRGSLMDVPPFLDESLKPWRERLRAAARGKGPIEDALEARAIREARALELRGKGSIHELRKIYSVGLSSQTAKEILVNLRLALHRTTVHIRGPLAGVCVLLGAIVFAVIFYTPIHANIVQGWAWSAQLLLDVFILFGTMSLAEFALSAFTSLVLRRRFPELKITLRQKTGRIAYALLGGVAFMFAIVLITAPVKSLWLLRLFGHDGG